MKTRHLSRYVRAAISALGAAMLVLGALGDMAHASDQTTPLTPLSLNICVNFAIQTEDSFHVAVAEFANTRETRSQGMMYRTDLPEDSAMIFDMEGRSEVRFWMKNTPSSLDIAFFDTDGRLIHLEAAVTPLSTMLVGPDPDAHISYALEVPAGIAERIGLKVDLSRINVGAALPCPSGFP